MNWEYLHSGHIHNLIPKSTIGGLPDEIRLLNGTHKIHCKSWFLKYLYITTQHIKGEQSLTISFSMCQVHSLLGN